MAGMHEGGGEMTAAQDAVKGVFNGDRFGRVRRVEFKRELSLSCCGNGKKIGMGDRYVFFFFIMPEFSDGKEAAKTFNISFGWIEFSFI